VLPSARGVNRSSQTLLEFRSVRHEWQFESVNPYESRLLQHYSAHALGLFGRVAYPPAAFGLSSARDGPECDVDRRVQYARIAGTNFVRSFVYLPFLPDRPLFHF
jgi:hypothetical protein